MSEESTVKLAYIAIGAVAVLILQPLAYALFCAFMDKYFGDDNE